MQAAPRSSATKIAVSSTCTIYEYTNLGTEKTNGAVAEIRGRYPKQGWAVNHISDELVYVLEGKGKIIGPDKMISLQKGDIAYIHAGERFAWDGNIEVFIPCFPAWRSEQHEIIEEK